VPSSVLTSDSPDVPFPDVSNTPEPLADTNASGSIEIVTPAASEPPAAEALSIYSLYLDSDQFVCAEHSAALKLVLVANNAYGTLLQSFGIRFDIPEDMPLKVNSVNGSDLVRFSGQTLWVEGAIVQDGRVTVAGEDLHLTLAFLPFPAGSQLTSACVSIVLLDERGNEVNLNENEGNHALINLSITYQREQQDVSALEPDGTEPAREDAAGVTDQPPVESGQQQMADTKYAPPFLTIEPDDSDVTSSSVDTANQSLPEEPAQAQSAASSPEPSQPSVIRQLQLAANIPYSELEIGDTLNLTAVITGYEGLKMCIQWQQCSQDEWTNLQGENGDTLTILITPDNIRCAWRYDVTVEK